MSSLYWMVIFCLNLSIVRGKLEPCFSLKGAVFVNKKCLVAFDILLTWKEACDFCRFNLFSGKLAEPVTLEERQAAVEIVKEFGKTVWLGASDQIAEGRFVWTESKVILSSTGPWWATKQPDDSRCDEDCVEMLTSQNQSMNDNSCKIKNPPLCEIGITPGKLVMDPCYPWKNALLINGMCLKIFTNLLDWEKAKLFCGAVDPQLKLVELLTEEEKKDVQHFATDMGITSYWIGGRRLNVTKGLLNFVWETTPNTSLPVNLWEDGQPNNSDGNQYCLCMMNSSLLNDQNCSQNQSYFICENYNCNTSATIVNEKCFNIIRKKLTMTDAQKNCTDSGGRLAELTTYEEFQSVQKVVKGTNFSYWIGGHDLDHDGTFVWNASKIPIPLNWWKVITNKTDTNCVAMNSSDGKFDNLNCAEKLAFMCQRVPRSPCDEILDESVYASNYCFKYFKTNKTRRDAQLDCFHDNSHLAEPTTAEMEGNLMNYLHNYLGSFTNTTIWLGGTEMNRTGSFTWETNGDLIKSTHLSILPGNRLSYHLAWCNLGSDYKWENRHSEEQHGFICQTAAVFDDPHQYVAVLPKMSHNGLPTGHLQATAGYSFVIYVTFTAYHYGDLINKTTLPLAPKHDVQYDMDQLLTFPGYDVSSRYVLIESSQPVTIILYITDLAMNQSSSTLIFPVSFYQAMEADLSYILVSVFDEQTADDILSVVAMSDLETDVLVVNSNHGCPSPSLTSGQAVLKNLIFTKANMKFMYSTMTISGIVNLTGAYLNTTRPVAVLIGSFGHKVDDFTSDSAIDQILPIPYTGSEYFVFPSYPINSQTTDVLKCIALHDWTHIYILIENNTIRRIMQSAGDVLEIPFDTTHFIHVQGNASFYVYKISSKRTDAFHQACLTTILPSNAWRHEYDLVINSMLQSYKVIIYLVVETNLTEQIEINSNQSPSNLSCTDIIGSSYSGCDYRIDSTTQHYFHIGLGDKQNKFGAYLYASNTRSAMCHPLGITHTLEPSADAHFDYLEAYLNKLISAINRLETVRFLTDTTTFDNGVTSAQITDEDTYSTNEDILIVTQTSDLIKSYESDNSPFVEVATESTNPDESNYIVFTSQSPNATKVTTRSHLETVEQLKEKIAKTLYIDALNTSSYRRTKISVPDERPSAVVAGSVGIAIIATVFSLIFMYDIRYFVCFLISCLKNKIKCFL